MISFTVAEMRLCSSPVLTEAPDAHGQIIVYDRTLYRVEERDVGSIREHFGGYGHRKVRFSASDVGKKVLVYTSPGWTCWFWG